MLKYDVVVVGGGPAGMAAALSAKENGAEKIIILDREENLGGILRQCIHNGFGLHKLGKELTGPEYAEHYEKLVKKTNIEVLLKTMVTNINKEKIVTAQCSKGIIKIKAKAIVLSMGCRERSRGALNICGTRPAGVFSAGTAQKLMNIDGFKVGKNVVILGSGDIGLIMARRMTLEGSKVKAVCEIMPYSGGLTRNIVQCLNDYDIPLYLSTTVAEIHGKERLTGVTIAKVDKQNNIIEKTKRYIPCDTLLLSCGLIPENELTISSGINIDNITNGAIVDEHRQTSADGIFACGNVLQVHDLVDYVSIEAEIAGKYAALYALNKINKSEQIKVNAVNGVRYTVPQYINKQTDGDVSIFFRVSSPHNTVRLYAKCGNTILAKQTKVKAVPGEMEKITIKQDLLKSVSDNIEVGLEEI